MRPGGPPFTLASYTAFANNSITGFTMASIAVIVLIFAAALLGAFIFMKHWP
jgi:hypothetical protein